MGRRAEPTPAVPASTAAETAPPPSTEPPAPVRPSGLREIGDLTLLPGETVLGLCPDGDAPAALLQRWDPEGQVWRSRLVRLGKTGRARAMGEMMASLPGGGLDETLSWRTQDGWAWVCPSDERNECRVVAESAREETARDLCDELCGLLGEAKRGEEQ